MKWRRLKFTGIEPEGLRERERGRERERKWKGERGMVSDGRRRVGEMKRRRGAKRHGGEVYQEKLGQSSLRQEENKPCKPPNIVF